MEKSMDAARVFSQYAVGLRYEAIPPETREAVKTSILDTLGVAIAASTLGEGISQLVELIKEAGGKGESTILAFGGKVPAWMAALANGSMVRALDYDDTHDTALTHPSATTLPATLAMAERLGAVSGKDFITAVSLGNDITSRMGLSITKRPRGWKLDWFLTTVHGVFGAAAACGKLLGLDAEKLQNALGIALYDSAGTMEAFAPGAASVMTGMSCGFASKAGVLSALMAQKGINGAKDSLEGKAGMYNLYFEGDYNRDILLNDLGKRFESANISIKPWPGVRYAHPYIDATLQLVREHSLAPDAIKQIRLLVAGWVETLCQPLELALKPANRDDANRSIPYQVAVAALKKGVTGKDLSQEALKDPATLKFAQRVMACKHDEEFGAENKMGPGMVEIELTDGKVYSRRVDVAYGNPRNPITPQDLADKFRNCALSSAKPLPERNVEKIIEMVGHLEEVDDVGRVVRLCS
ncbi:MAG: MmgE/PrpD family protein [Chloroflexi bacterium]|nr:MmgE/PrpD family protein [Chloroflexota bacterium]